MRKARKKGVLEKRGGSARASLFKKDGSRKKGKKKYASASSFHQGEAHFRPPWTGMWTRKETRELEKRKKECYQIALPLRFLREGKESRRKKGAGIELKYDHTRRPRGSFRSRLKKTPNRRKKGDDPKIKRERKKAASEQGP